jgi:hypothetical protein
MELVSPYGITPIFAAESPLEVIDVGDKRGAM